MKDDSQVYPVVENIWCEILGVQAAQPTDSFFEHGGTSIAAEQIASRISDALPIAMNGGDILKRRTLSNVVELAVSRLA